MAVLPGSVLIGAWPPTFKPPFEVAPPTPRLASLPGALPPEQASVQHNDRAHGAKRIPSIASERLTHFGARARLSLYSFGLLGGRGNDSELDAPIVLAPLFAVVRVDRSRLPEAVGAEALGSDAVRDQPLHHGRSSALAEIQIRGCAATAIGVAAHFEFRDLFVGLQYLHHGGQYRLALWRQAIASRRELHWL